MQVDILASGTGWSASDIRCSSGPRDRRFEEQHHAVCIAVVLRGSFQYRTTQGAGTLAPGAILLGNPGHCFECGHDHATGDQCLSFQFDPVCFDDVLSATPGARTEAFPVARMPPLMALAPTVAAADMARIAGDPAAIEEAALALAGCVVSLAAGSDRDERAPATRDERRITAALRHIERQVHQPIRLTDLARDAAMSRYHFLRTFSRVVGLTPHQFVLRTRLQHAAVELSRSARPVLDIALDVGFGDLSTFNRLFRRTFGVAPSPYRQTNLKPR